jgi:hypothetical protein
LKKKLSVLMALVSALVVFAVPATPSMAACSGSDGDSRETATRPVYDENGDPVLDENGNQVYETYFTEGDYLLKESPFDDPIDADDDGDVDQTGTIVYGAFNGDSDGGYIGSTGSVGYIELKGDASDGQAQIDGRESGGQIDGRITLSASPGVCVNGQGT